MKDSSIYHTRLLFWPPPSVGEVFFFLSNHKPRMRLNVWLVVFGFINNVFSCLVHHQILNWNSVFKLKLRLVELVGFRNIWERERERERERDRVAVGDILFLEQWTWLGFPSTDGSREERDDVNSPPWLFTSKSPLKNQSSYAREIESEASRQSWRWSTSKNPHIDTRVMIRIWRRSPTNSKFSKTHTINNATMVWASCRRSGCFPRSASVQFRAASPRGIWRHFPFPWQPQHLTCCLHVRPLQRTALVVIQPRLQDLD